MTKEENEIGMMMRMRMMIEIHKVEVHFQVYLVLVEEVEAASVDLVEEVLVELEQVVIGKFIKEIKIII
jgi:hypothetical protein